MTTPSSATSDQTAPPVETKPPLQIIDRKRRVILTYVILVIISVIYFGQMLYSQLNYPATEPLTAWGMLDFRRIVAGDIYRLFTAMFLHASPAHLVFNGIALFYSGRIVEYLFGSIRFGVIYLLSGLTGSLASFIMSQGRGVGASGALFGIFAAEMIYLYQNRERLGKEANGQIRSLAVLLVINMGLGMYSQLANTPVRIDNWAHIGGFIGGWILTWFIGPKFRLVPDPEKPDTARLDDGVPRSQLILVPVLYTAGLVAILAYALSVYR